MKNIKYIIAALVLAFVVVSCESYDDYNADRQVIIGFATGDGNIPTVSSAPRTKDVDVFATEISSSDRTLTIGIDAAGTEVSPENYSIPSTVTILAGERYATFTATFMNFNLTPVRKPVTLTLAGTGDYLIGKNKVTFQVKGN